MLEGELDGHLDYDKTSKIKLKQFSERVSQGLHDLPGRVIKPYVHGQCLTVAIVHNIEHPYFSSVRKHVRHEVHAPYLIDHCWYIQRVLFP